MCKKVKGTWAVFVAFVLFACAFFTNVHAEEVYYSNNNSVQMTEAEYNKLATVFSDLKIATISQEEFDKYVNANIVSQDAVYQKTTSLNGVIISTEEVTKEEYENSSSIANTCGPQNRDNDSAFYETAYKKQNVTLFDGGSFFDLICDLSWKQVPLVRSYDVFAFLLSHFNFTNKLKFFLIIFLVFIQIYFNLIIFILFS